MRYIIDYIRQIFCKHDWLIEEMPCQITDYEGKIMRTGEKVYMRCKKCGYHKRHWKV